MGKVRKFDFKPRILDDSMVKDGLEAVSTLNDKEPYFLVGGIATQSYLPTKCRRPTSDMDFALVRPLSKPGFREMVKPVKEFLQDKGYHVDMKTSNRSRSFAMYVSKDNDLGSICLEFVRRNKKNFDKHKKRLEREYDHCRDKIMEERDATYKVSSPEDIAVPKIVRSIGSLERYPDIFAFVPPKMKSFSEKKVCKRLDLIKDMREEATSNPGDPLLAEKLRFVSDIYDVRVLSEMTGFNQNYFKSAEEDWYTMKESPVARDTIFRMSLPSILRHEEHKFKEDIRK